MEPYFKDLIDVISKIGGLITVFVGIFLAWDQLRKRREQKEREIQKHELEAKAQFDLKERELQKRDFELKTQRAIFWLDLRKMFEKFDETHRMLRYGTWPFPYDQEIEQSNEELRKRLKKQLPELEAYMGLFEHCKHMMDDELIDLPTFKSIYGYRIKNIVGNKHVVNSKFNPKTRKGWKDFIDLAEKVGYNVPSKL